MASLLSSVNPLSGLDGVPHPSDEGEGDGEGECSSPCPKFRLEDLCLDSEMQLLSSGKTISSI